MARTKTRIIPHHIKERQRHQNIQKLLENIANHVPRRKNFKETKTKKLRRVVLYLKYLTEKKSQVFESRSNIGRSYWNTKKHIFPEELMNTNPKSYKVSSNSSSHKAHIVFVKRFTELCDTEKKTNSTITASEAGNSSSDEVTARDISIACSSTCEVTDLDASMDIAFPVSTDSDTFNSAIDLSNKFKESDSVIGNETCPIDFSCKRTVMNYPDDVQNNYEQFEKCLPSEIADPALGKIPVPVCVSRNSKTNVNATVSSEQNLASKYDEMTNNKTFNVGNSLFSNSAMTCEYPEIPETSFQINNDFPLKQQDNFNSQNIFHPLNNLTYGHSSTNKLTSYWSSQSSQNSSHDFFSSNESSTLPSSYEWASSYESVGKNIEGTSEVDAILRPDNYVTYLVNDTEQGSTVPSHSLCDNVYNDMGCCDLSYLIASSTSDEMMLQKEASSANKAVESSIRNQLAKNEHCERSCNVATAKDEFSHLDSCLYQSYPVVSCYQNDVSRKDPSNVYFFENNFNLEDSHIPNDYINSFYKNECRMQFEDGSVFNAPIKQEEAQSCLLHDEISDSLNNLNNVAYDSGNKYC